MSRRKAEVIILTVWHTIIFAWHTLNLAIQLFALYFSLSLSPSFPVYTNWAVENSNSIIFFHKIYNWNCALDLLINKFNAKMPVLPLASTANKTDEYPSIDGWCAVRDTIFFFLDKWETRLRNWETRGDARNEIKLNKRKLSGHSWTHRTDVIWRMHDLSEKLLFTFCLFLK